MIIDAAQMADCGELAVPTAIMEHVVRVESSFNRYAIGVVGGRLARQPRTLKEAVATARALRDGGWNYSLGLSQVNRSNLKAQGLDDHEVAFAICPNLRAGARILADCRDRFGTWGAAFSCYYSGNPRTGFTHGYVQKIQASMAGAGSLPEEVAAIAVVPAAQRTPTPPVRPASRVALRTMKADSSGTDEVPGAERDPARVF